MADDEASSVNGGKDDSVAAEKDDSVSERSHSVAECDSLTAEKAEKADSNQRHGKPDAKDEEAIAENDNSVTDLDESTPEKDSPIWDRDNLSTSCKAGANILPFSRIIIGEKFLKS